jgi:hypothetical protein
VRFVGSLVVAAALLIASAATAKEFQPGGLRVCGVKRCAPITDQKVLDTFSAFLYGSQPARAVHAPAAGARIIDLRFKDRWRAGIVGGTRLDRMLVNGLNCGRFSRGSWYRLPPRASLEVRRLAATLGPVRRIPIRVPRSC